MYIYIYIYIYVCVCVCVCVHSYIHTWCSKSIETESLKVKNNSLYFWILAKYRIVLVRHSPNSPDSFSELKIHLKDVEDIKRNLMLQLYTISKVEFQWNFD